jgi:aryl-alcohol dehydrogenase-like predicted oxidoreductase
MALNHYVTLGRTGLRVSPMCLGTMTFGEDWGWGSTVKDSETILDHYIELGGNFIDTANVYTKGHSEKIIGDHLGKHASRRQKTVIATKFFGTLFPGDPNGGGANRKTIMAACENSLRRLSTDYIDLYWMHAWDKFTPIEETMRALEDLVTSGKVRYVGFSDTPAWKCAQAQTMATMLGRTTIAAIQIEYSLLERTVEGDLIPMAREMGMGVTPWSPLKSGALSGKHTRQNAGKSDSARGAWALSALTEKAYDIIDALSIVASERGATVAQVALAWVCAQPGVTSPIIGARTFAQLEDNLSALNVVLTTKDLKILSDISEPTLNFPANFLKNSGVFCNAGTTVNGETSTFGR